MKIAYLITSLGIGGAETSTVNIANEMARRGHDVLIVYLTGGNSYSEVIDPTITVAGIGMSKTPLSLIWGYIKARRIIKRFRPDIAHGQMIHANLFLRLLRITTSLTLLISTEHTKYIGGKIRLLAYRLTDPLSDVNTNVSEEATKLFIQTKAFSAKKSRTVYNGIDLSKFVRNQVPTFSLRQKYRIGDDEFLFLNVGRLTLAKDHHNLLKAISSLDTGRLLIVGEGDCRSQIEKDILNMGLANRVILTGAQTNIPEYCNAADCFVLSSAWEGFGIVLAEAMACELPVIATNAGGTAEVIQDREWIVPIKDSNALAKKMERILQMPKNERQLLGKRNRNQAAKFDLNHICDQWEQIYRESITASTTFR